ncbi:hypothetical protein [Marinoscillum furvescens]|uniref:Uncharacterized protein n=1 Tax=Marinoscillum furvescens DSM 4134 TaxID=1122208 RepID=A0A3D9L2A5_MARFU|nr:hypothetical protein [Marinoscillum furvescens]RED97514.1 hypothetical protein C7460_112124 [Marinoscillum furvescens DSM 4134]
MRNVQGRFFSTVLLAILSITIYAQQLSIKGGFIEDSLRIGEDIHYYLTASYPASLEILLPDTTYDFRPFEFSDKTFFPSQTDGNMVYDSAIYVLQSYEIDAVQYLSLPGFVLNEGGDSTKIEVKPDSIYFSEMAPVVTDTTRLKTNMAYQDVSKEVNTPLIGIIAAVLGLIGVLVWVLFGKKIQKALKLRRLKKEYTRFSEQLTLNIRQLKEKPEQRLAERTVALWKGFLERMESKPFTKLTTREIMAMEYTQELKEVLKNIDRCIYGGHADANLYKEFQAIEDFTQHRYSVVTDHIKNS